MKNRIECIRWIGLFINLWTWGFVAGAAPYVTGFTPDFGPPGTQVRIIGSGFRPTLIPPIVQFGGATATLMSANQNEILAVVPDDATIGPVTVTVPNGGGQYTTPFYFYPPPRITDFGTEILGTTGETVVFQKPVVFKPGGTLTITGFNFYVPGFPELLVKVGSTPIAASLSSQYQVQATLPALLETGFLSVRTRVGDTTNRIDYIYGPPRIYGFTPKATAGETIDIRGVNFLTLNPTQIQVRFGGIQASHIEVQSNTHMLATLPNQALSGPVSVSVPGGSFITSSNLTVLPKLDSFTPKSGPAGTLVVLQGSGLSGTTKVRFGNLLANAFTNISPSEIHAVVPAGIQTGSITMENPNGTASTAELFFGPPRIDRFTPVSGSYGTAVTVEGMNFTGATQVQLNGMTALFGVVDNQHVSLIVPESATNGKIRVITPGGSVESTTEFTVGIMEPILSSFSPLHGGPGTPVLLNGYLISTATNVLFNGVPATFKVLQLNQIEATVPTGASTGKIQVGTPRGMGESVGWFVVGTEADLRITVSAQPNPAVAYGPMVYNLQAYNGGPLPAENTVVEFELPEGTTLITVAGPQQPVISGRKLTFNRGTLDISSLFVTSIQVQAGEAREVVATAKVLSSTPDSNLANNSRSITTVISMPRLAIEQLEGGEVLVYWPSAAGTLYQLMESATLEGPYTRVTDPPSDDGANLQLTLPTSNSKRLLRLDLIPPLVQDSVGLTDGGFAPSVR